MRKRKKERDRDRDSGIERDGKITERNGMESGNWEVRPSNGAVDGKKQNILLDSQEGA